LGNQLLSGVGGTRNAGLNRSVTIAVKAKGTQTVSVAIKGSVDSNFTLSYYTVTVDFATGTLSNAKYGNYSSPLLPTTSTVTSTPE